MKAQPTAVSRREPLAPPRYSRRSPGRNHAPRIEVLCFESASSWAAEAIGDDGTNAVLDGVVGAYHAARDVFADRAPARVDA